jgi:isopenicillin-N N-acyltransferase-like protein
MSNEKFPVIDCTGSFYDMGLTHGRECKELIQRTLRRLQRTTGVTSKKDMVEMAAHCLPYAEEYAPELVEEVKGIAEGAEIDFGLVFALNCYSELWYAAAGLGKVASEGCTTFGVTPIATKSGKTYLAWNCDFYEWWEDTVIFLRLTSQKVAPLLVFTYAGLVGANAGINRHFAFVVNGLASSGKPYGVPYSFICRKALQQRTMGDAIEAILTAKRSIGSSKNFLLANASGELYSIETSSDDYEVIFPTSGYIGHTNHYTTLKMKLKGLGRTKGTSQSILRWARINTLLGESVGHIDYNTLIEFMKDHANHPASICRHTDRDDQSQDGLYFSTTLPDSKTIAGLIFDLCDLRMFVARGNPCCNEFKEYEVFS